MTAFLTDALHWSLIVAGAFLTIAVISIPVCQWLGRRFGSMTTTDPDYCRDKAIEFAGDAYREREG